MKRRRRWLWLALGGLALGLAVGGVLFFVWRSERVVVTLVPGRSVWEAARTIDAKLPGTHDAVLALVSDADWARAQGLPVRSRGARGDGVPESWLEGFIYPETYFFRPGASAEDVLLRATSEFREVFGALQSSHATAFAALESELGIGPAEVVVLASLVEEEAALRSEGPRIAGVFLNRLRRGMRLETDPTLMYRPDRVAKVPTPRERKDATNPYNTYAFDGLPPGPICSPGKAALTSVLEAETHDLVFFVARQDGSRAHAFAATVEEHDANVDRYLRKKGP